MSFFTFKQNNSGGSFQESDNYGYAIIIEASSAQEANTKAEELGLYFDGVVYGRDCSCCGDRWYPVTDDDADDEPCMYGTPVAKAAEERGIMWWKLPVIVHYLNGNRMVYRHSQD